MIPITTKEELINHLTRIEKNADNPCPNFESKSYESDKELIKIIDEIPCHGNGHDSCMVANHSKEEVFAYLLQKIQEHNSLS